MNAMRVVSFLAAVCVLAVSSKTLAWSVYSKGPWVLVPPYDPSQPEQGGTWSQCSCDGFAIGRGHITTWDNVSLRLYAPEDDYDCFIGMELESYDPDGNKRPIPANHAFPNQNFDERHATMSVVTGGWVKQPNDFWLWEFGYSRTGRYRAVCVNNSDASDLFPSHEELEYEPWFY